MTADSGAGVAEIMRRYMYVLLYTALALLAGCGAIGSSGSATATTMPIFTDIDRLGSRISLPTGVTAATWTVIALGSGGSGIGPTDTQLYALISLDDTGWQTLGQPGTPTEVALPIGVAEAVLPPALRDTLTEQDGQLQVSGQAYDPTRFESSLYQPSYAVRLGQQLLVCLQTR